MPRAQKCAVDLPQIWVRASSKAEIWLINDDSSPVGAEDAELQMLRHIHTAASCEAFKFIYGKASSNRKKSLEIHVAQR